MPITVVPASLVAFVVALASGLAQAAPVIEAIQVVGSVSVGDQTLEPGARYQILEGSVVQTGADGNVFGRLPDGSQIRIKEDTILRVNVIEPDGEQHTRRHFDLEAGTIEYLADPSATVDLRITTIRGEVLTRDADVSVRVDAYQGETEFACVIVHNVDHTSVVEGRPDVDLSILKDDVEMSGRVSGMMNPGSVVVLCPKIIRTFQGLSRRSVENATDAIPIVRIQEASPFRSVEVFDF